MEVLDVLSRPRAGLEGEHPREVHAEHLAARLAERVVGAARPVTSGTFGSRCGRVLGGSWATQARADLLLGARLGRHEPGRLEERAPAGPGWRRAPRASTSSTENEPSGRARAEDGHPVEGDEHGVPSSSSRRRRSRALADGEQGPQARRRHGAR